MPPFILYKGKKIYEEWTKDGPKDAVYTNSESGWMTKSLFEEWFKSVFLKYTAPLDGSKLLFLDGENLH